MKVKCKVELLESLYRAEVINSAKERDALFEEVDRLLIENSDLKEEVSEQHYEIERLKKYISDLKKIKMGDDTDFMMDCVPHILRKKITAENSD